MASLEGSSKKNPIKHLAQNIIDSTNGLRIMFRESGTIHRIYPLMIIGGLALGITFSFITLEWIILIALLLLDLIVETINTAIEETCDVVTREYHPGIERAKDLGSAAVYLCHLAFIIAAIFFSAEHSAGYEWWEHLIPS